MKCGFPIESLPEYMRVFENQRLPISIVENIDDNYEYVSKILKKIDIDNITPIEALNELAKLKELVK